MHRLKFLWLVVLTLVLFVADLVLGSVSIPLKELPSALFSNESEAVYREILLQFRLPKALTAVMAGAGLSVAGLLMQTLFRNPLAGPDVLGVNAGAGLGVALTTLLASGAGGVLLSLGSWGLVTAAILGAIVVLLLVLLTSFRVPDLVTLLIVGMMFGYIGSALVSVLQSFSNPDTLKIFIVWTFGSLSAVSWDMMPVLAVVIALGLLLSFAWIKSLNALLLGESYAIGLGVSVKRVRWVILVATALLAGGITAFAGPITFIGITVPHMARGLFRTWDHRIVMPASMLCGSALLLLCDMLAQLPGMGGTVLPINSVTALFGAPMVIWILLKNNK
ncbi:MAG: iron ABC transporter permease [Bacteroidales bacterium]|jgi:iron complex transport system permease protein|nr:iron ABC transporter permease [Bacteroidales bacterium]MDD4770239.1 iron ABC transporter permease [Bacteroidales bacterium]